MTTIRDRLDKAAAMVKYHNPKKYKNVSDRILCWEIATEMFIEKIKQISDTFESIDKKSYKSKYRYFNCFENMFEKSKRIVVCISLAAAVFFRHLGGAVIHPNLSLKPSRVKS